MESDCASAKDGVDLNFFGRGSVSCIADWFFVSPWYMANAICVLILCISSFTVFFTLLDAQTLRRCQLYAQCWRNVGYYRDEERFTYHFTRCLDLFQGSGFEGHLPLVVGPTYLSSIEQKGR